MRCGAIIIIITLYVTLHHNTSTIAKPGIATNQGMGTLRTWLYCIWVFAYMAGDDRRAKRKMERNARDKRDRSSSAVRVPPEGFLCL